MAADDGDNLSDHEEEKFVYRVFWAVFLFICVVITFCWGVLRFIYWAVIQVYTANVVSRIIYSIVPSNFLD